MHKIWSVRLHEEDGAAMDSLPGKNREEKLLQLMEFAVQHGYGQESAVMKKRMESGVLPAIPDRVNFLEREMKTMHEAVKVLFTQLNPTQ